MISFIEARLEILHVFPKIPSLRVFAPTFVYQGVLCNFPGYYSMAMAFLGWDSFEG